MMERRRSNIPEDWLSVTQMEEMCGLSHSKLGNAASKTGMRWKAGMSAYDAKGRRRYSPEAVREIIARATTDSEASQAWMP